MSRLVSLMAESAVSFAQPMPTSWSGWPPIDPPCQPADGLFGLFGFAPPNCETAVIAPPMSCS